MSTTLTPSQRASAWRKANPKKAAESRMRYRRRFVAGGPDVTEEERAALFQNAGYRCLDCHRHKTQLSEPLVLDHVVPLKDHGLNCAANRQVLCPPCNRRKGAKTIDFRGESHHGCDAGQNSQLHVAAREESTGGLYAANGDIRVLFHERIQEMPWIQEAVRRYPGYFWPGDGEPTDDEESQRRPDPVPIDCGTRVFLLPASGFVSQVAILPIEATT